MAEFSEQVLWRDDSKKSRLDDRWHKQVLWRDDSKKSRLDDRWHKGVYLGPCLRSSDSLVGTAECAVVKARTFRRLPESQKAAAAW
eukprot:2539542-Amphidinium_carterae.1